ncbi:MAG: 16S rRNA processing protein RimM [Candidatus Latescibacteria bacterium]|nr:16S rRNA processing protein RimM [Candidatus Latescibacterota bacterium]
MTVEWITIGLVLKPHGYRGEVKVQPMTDVPDRFKGLERVWLEWPDGRRQEIQVARWRDSHDVQLMKAQGIETLEAAEALRGAYILVRHADAAPLPDGRYYVFDLIGLRVVTERGDEVGTVRDVLPLPANDVYVVQSRDGDVLIPAIRDVVVSIDLAAGQMIIRPVPGLWSA